MLQRAAVDTECIVRLDRVVFRSDAELKSVLQTLSSSSFRKGKDHALRNINAGVFSGPYGRVRELTCDRTKTRIRVLYRPRYRRLPAMRVSVVPDDQTGQQRDELETILEAFAPCELLIVEIALDFRRRTE
jgi:hypothetical protein